MSHHESVSRIFLAGKLDRDQAAAITDVRLFQTLIRLLWRIDRRTTDPPDGIMMPDGAFVYIDQMLSEHLPRRMIDDTQFVWWLGDITETFFRKRVGIFFVREDRGKRMLPHFGVRADVSGQLDLEADGPGMGEDFVIFEHGMTEGPFGIASHQLVRAIGSRVIQDYCPTYAQAKTAMEILAARVLQLRQSGRGVRAAALHWSRPLNAVAVLNAPLGLLSVSMAGAHIASRGSNPLLPGARGRELAARAAGDD